MQEPARLPEFLAHFAKNTLFLSRSTNREMKSWPELGTLSFDYPRIPPPENEKIGQNSAL